MIRWLVTVLVLALGPAACAEGPVSYNVSAIAPLLSIDSLETRSVARARSLGLTVYEPSAAMARLQDLQIRVDPRDDFLFVDRRVSCGSWLTHSPFCQQVDFLIVSFPEMNGRRVVLVAAGTDQRLNPLAEWHLRKASAEIRAAADSMAGTFGAVSVLTGN